MASTKVVDLVGVEVVLLRLGPHCAALRLDEPVHLLVTRPTFCMSASCSNCASSGSKRDFRSSQARPSLRNACRACRPRCRSAGVGHLADDVDPTPHPEVDRLGTHRITSTGVRSPTWSSTTRSSFLAKTGETFAEDLPHAGEIVPPRAGSCCGARRLYWNGQPVKERIAAPPGYPVPSRRPPHRRNHMHTWTRRRLLTSAAATGASP